MLTLPVNVSPDLRILPPPIILAKSIESPFLSQPRRLSMYPSTAVSVGTASPVAFVKVASGLNSLTRTPRLNPIPSMFVRTSAALNVILPVP